MWCITAWTRQWPPQKNKTIFSFCLSPTQCLCLVLSNLFFRQRFMLFYLLVQALECTVLPDLVCCPSWAICLFGSMMTKMFTFLSHSCHLVLLYASVASRSWLYITIIIKDRKHSKCSKLLTIWDCRWEMPGVFIVTNKEEPKMSSNTCFHMCLCNATFRVVWLKKQTKKSGWNSSTVEGIHYL